MYTRKQPADALKKCGSSIKEFEGEVNAQEGRIKYESFCLQKVINGSMLWMETRLGSEYWKIVYNAIQEYDPKVIAKAGECAPSYAVYSNEENLVVGCQTITPKMQQRLFEILAVRLGYEIH